MAPSPIRQLLVWSLPSVAVLLSYLWYKKRRIGARSDTRGSKPIEETATNQSEPLDTDRVRKSEPLNIVTAEAHSTTKTSPTRSFNRSLSGVETAPIDIIYPKELKSTKSSPIVISDEDLDLEIEKIKSMRDSAAYNSGGRASKTPSPAKSGNKPSVAEEDFASPRAKSEIKKESFEHTIIVGAASKENSPVVAELQEPIAAQKSTPKKAKDKKSKQKMAQKEVAAVEEKMTALTVSVNNDCPKKSKAPKANQTSRKNSARDSANHSPADAMMASPSLSSMSDNHSEGSNDSGKGGSDVATPPSSGTPQLTTQQLRYEFVIPSTMAGKLIGKHGNFVQTIKESCSVYACLDNHPTNNRLKLCILEGTQAGIDKALKLIRNRFPVKNYPKLSLKQVIIEQPVPTISLIPDYLYLKLVDGINNDTVLSCIVTPNHLFLQQPTHPSYPSLSLLTNYINTCYNSGESPLLPRPIPENTICIAFSADAWVRALVLSTDEEADTSHIKILDYGGYANIENDKLRQIRQDFMLLPFQAAECYLANVKPKSEDGTWPSEAYYLIAELTKGSIIYTQVAAYGPDEIPLVFCYAVSNHDNVIFLNQRLVDEGFADWVPFDEVALPKQEDQQDATEVAPQPNPEAEALEGL